MATAKETMENQVDAELDFASMLDNYVSSDMGDLEEGSIVEGVIVRVDDDNVLVDVNFKSEGQIPAAEFRDAQGNIMVNVGERVCGSQERNGRDYHPFVRKGQAHADLRSA